MNLALSLVALALGPFLYGACQRNEFLRSALDGLLVVTIAGLVVVHIVPDAFDVAGYAALLFLAAGVVVAFLVERRPVLDGGDRYSLIIALGAIALVIHAAMDGIALLPVDQIGGAESGHHDGHAHEGDIDSLLSNHLALGVILHRIPVGMAIWWAVRPQLGRGIAIGALLIIAIATSAAYILGEPFIALMEARSIAFFQAFVGGTLLHVVVLTSARGDSGASEKPHANKIIGERLGIIVGIILLFLVPHAH